MRPGQWAVFAALVVLIIGSAALAVHRIRQRSPASVTSTTPVPPASASTQGVPAALRERVGTMDLPESNEATNHVGQLNLVITTDAIHVEHERMASLPVPPSDGKLQRVDALYNVLRARRDAWKANNPGRSFDGLVALWVDRRVSVYAVKSVFMTAAFVGYASPGFVARCRCPQGITVLPAHARVPGPPGEPPPLPVRDWALEVVQRTDTQVELVWRASDVPAQSRSVATSNILPTIEQLWISGQRVASPER